MYFVLNFGFLIWSWTVRIVPLQKIASIFISFDTKRYICLCSASETWTGSKTDVGGNQREDYVIERVLYELLETTK